MQLRAGLYIHVPFCIRKCPYCDFFSVTDQSRLPAFAAAVAAEMEMRREAALVFDTIYFGGGTPSLLDAGTAARLLDAARRAFAVSDDAEITIEANPGTVSLDQLEGYRRAGVNRINIGVQSFDDENLFFLGRIHSAAESEGALDMVQEAGFDNIGLDLIYGLPGQTEGNWRQDLLSAVSWRPAHIACYMLTCEPATPLDADRRAGRFSPMPEDQQAQLYEQAARYLADAGYDHYEISNFAASKDLRSRHNMKYWTGAPYIGLGPAAHSYREFERYWNCRSVDQYLEAVESNRSPVAGAETLTREQRIIETIYLGLRQREGIDAAGFEETFGVGFEAVFGDAIRPIIRSGDMCFDGNRYRLTPAGRLRLDGIAAHLVARM